ncbi:DUF2778 domain-containing protein [Paraburkholderia azotifigens]|uniref:DUF2778 domain-containing protein n=1 Tax=Paraburkholderia azotifigens TaxID=2057004 RepID=A0A5C6VD80_9BURK|nr:DUF2778 domain-containing protein [Paraburkholderia azotifigens]TXC83343.1 DUF2778 domain-containing protein [Paraburkholderia azotifigens]
MPVRCTFTLNSKERSELWCSGFGTVTAYSGKTWGRDNPEATASENVGPLPTGTYYIVDRQSGGAFGWARDLWSEYGWGTTDRTKWFALWNPNTGDTTMIHGIRRGAFRLHPEGQMRLSEGCITVVSRFDFDNLQRYLRSRRPDTPVPNSGLRAYGTVEVR